MPFLSVVALALVAMAWVGYPLVATLLSWLRPRSGSLPHPSRRRVSVVVATRDAPAAVLARVEDLLSAAHPRDLLEVVVAVDATVGADLSDYVALLPRAVRIVAGDPPGGKALTLNAGVRAATSDIVVFADSGQRFDPEAVPMLLNFLATHEEFGAVSGAYRMRPAAPGSLALRAFWALETQIRRAEARLHSLVAVTGAIYAIRRRLWRPLPTGLICDDLYVPLQVAASGFRVGFCEAALASDPRTFDERHEFSRKVRTLTGLLQVCRWYPWVLAPWRNPVWLQFVCHKLLRLATPYLLLAALVGLGPTWVSRAADLWPAGITTLALLVLAALTRPAAARRILRRVSWVLWLQTAPLVATVNAIRGRWDVWQHAARPAAPDASLTPA